MLPASVGRIDLKAAKLAEYLDKAPVLHKFAIDDQSQCPSPKQKLPRGRRELLGVPNALLEGQSYGSLQLP